MLSMKSLYSPLALVFQTSHEHLNTYHRISGRLLYTLLLLHGTWYINFFIQAGLLSKRLTSLVVWIGIIAFFGMTILVSASLQAIRRWSYRLFFISHLLTGIAILPLLFFHASPLRLYVIEALALFIFDILCRKLDTTTAFTTITPIPRTSLIRLSIPIPYPKIQRFKAAPGQHVYLSIPPNSVPTSSSSSAPNPHLYEFLFNPFTVASVTDTEITLVIRSLSGPTTLALSHLSHLNKAKPPINIEGPLGSSKHFPDFATEFDRVLLIAGGVGATFILPLYQDIQTKLVKEMRSSDRIRLVWCMRDISEASWASPELGLEAGEAESISLHVTGSGTTGSTYNSATDGGVELENVPSQSQRAGKAREGQLVHSEGRPDLRRAVDEMFRHGGEERVAVLVCGPHGMAREVRRHVGRWVEKGREVWWHDESFGW
jgi:NAD(P)H-flavin reductase